MTRLDTPSSKLTARQQREAAYYRAFVTQCGFGQLNFDPVTRGPGRPWNSYWYLYAAVRDAFRSGARLLDLGCGSGVAGLRCAWVGYNVVGVDICPENVAAAAAAARAHGLTARTHFLVSPAEQLGFPDGSFDAVVGLDVLHHVEIEPTIREVLRVLRPGGRAWFREPIAVPLFDRLRNAALLRRLVPNQPSLTRHITADERKLTSADLATMRRLCPTLVERRFAITSRVNRFLGAARHAWGPRLERFDRWLQRRIPPAARLGGCAVLTLQKPA